MRDSLQRKARQMRGLAAAAASRAARLNYLERAAIFEAQAGGLLVAVPRGRPNSGAAQATIWAFPAVD